MSYRRFCDNKQKLFANDPTWTYDLEKKCNHTTWAAEFVIKLFPFL